MKAYEIQESFGLDSLKVTARPDQGPGPGQVLVRVRAVSLNYRDLLTIQGQYNPRQVLPLIPVSDGAGEVVSIGEGVGRFRPGDRVVAAFSQGWISGVPTREKLSRSLGGPLDGMLREFAVLDEQGLLPVPEHLSYEEAATLPCAGVTAWNALMVQGGLKPGDSVLIQGTGGVAVFALQFAVMAGARAIVTSSSDEKLSRARELGAGDGINYRTMPAWDKQVRELTGGQGVDHVIEVGGAGTLSRSLRAVKIGGHISMIGVLSGKAAELSVTPILMFNIRVQGVMVGSREMFEEMNRAISLNRMKPVVGRVFSFDETRSALEYMAAGAHFGKIVITV